ncbi:MAG: polyprenyl synthetase family protein [Dermatophilaceae bacterium]|nr:polyprenyl synthetase family protein [Intrasporangiaceae bacterium]
MQHRTDPSPSGIEDIVDPEATFRAVDDVLERTFAEMTALLGEAGARDPGGEPTTAGLGVDAVRELAERSANHGKRVRPLLAHWGWVVAGGPTTDTADALARLGAALELLHLFALIQDDVMDRSDTRRGRPTLHVVASEAHQRHGGLGDPAHFGDAVATLVGDLALSEATLLGLGAGPAVSRAWRLMTLELVEGQLLDITHAADRSHDHATARRISRLKTGRYTVTRPLQLGALVAGATREVLDPLTEWGDLVGDAFGLRDDIIGVWGDPEVTGKPAGDDLLGGKPTALLVWAETLLPDQHRALLQRCTAGDLKSEQVTDLAEAMRASGVLARAEEEIDGLVRAAHAAACRLPGDPAVQSELDAVAQSIAWRSL